MPEPPSMRFIRSHIRAKRYRLTKHATIVRLEWESNYKTRKKRE